MAVIHQFPIKKRQKVYEYDNCGGCQKVISEDDHEGYMEIVLPFDDYDKHIVLCPSCHESAKRYGVL